MEHRLPPLEVKLFRLVRRGISFAEAALQLGIPRGSQNYYRKALLAHLAAGLHVTRWSKTPPHRNQVETRLRTSGPAAPTG